MVEIRFHGRGGQGTVIVSNILGDAVCTNGGFALSTPKFGVERRGAPVTAFVRTDNKKISKRYEIKNPDHVVVLDETLISAPGVNVVEGLREDGWIIINSTKDPSDFEYLGPYNIATVDATYIATEYGIGTPMNPIVNTTILGAIVRILKIVPIEKINNAIRKKIDSRVEDNISAARKAFYSVLF